MDGTLLCPRGSPGKNTGVGSHSLLQAVFPAQGSSPGLLQCRGILYRLNHQGSLGTLESKLYTSSWESQEATWYVTTECSKVSEVRDLEFSLKMMVKGTEIEIRQNIKWGWHHPLNGRELEQTPEKQLRPRKSGVLQPVGLQRAGHNLATEQQQ